MTDIYALLEELEAYLSNYAPPKEVHKRISKIKVMLSKIKV